MAIEIVDIPIKNGDFPVRYVSLPEGIYRVYIYTYIYMYYIYIYVYTNVTESVPFHRKGDGHTLYERRSWMRNILRSFRSRSGHV